MQKGEGGQAAVWQKRLANVDPDNPLRSDSRTRSICRGKGTNTRSPASRFNTIASVFLEEKQWGRAER